MQEILGTKRPIIAMCHFQALPGDPAYNAQKGMDWVLEMAHNDMQALQLGGVDALMFSNEFSLPYLTAVKPETTAAMAYIIGRLKKDITVPYGVNVLWDPFASIDLAAATGALFIREIMSGVYASDFGLWNTNVGEIVRHKMRLAPNIKLLFNIVPEAAKYLAARDVAEIAQTTEFNNKPDAICVSGATAGVSTDLAVLKRVKQNVRHTPVFANTGCTQESIADVLQIADGAVVGTAFKQNGDFNNWVDADRVTQFMNVVRGVR